MSPAVPSASDYLEAIQYPAGCFTVEDLAGGVVATDALGLPMVASGANAVVFKVDIRGWPTALRCFTNLAASNRDRYDALGAHMAERGPQAAANATWIDGAVLVGGEAWPVLVMEWIGGPTLDRHVDRLVAANDTGALGRLADSWRSTMGVLGRAGFAHGDLQHGNVLVDADGRLRLVDLDGVWIPELEGRAPPEVGHPDYQHPARAEDHRWDRYVDTFSALVVHVALRALAVEPDLWGRLHDSERLLLGRDDFLAPGATPGWQALLGVADDGARRLVSVLADCCRPDWREDVTLDDLVDRAERRPHVVRASRVIAWLPSESRPASLPVADPSEEYSWAKAPLPEPGSSVVPGGPAAGPLPRPGGVPIMPGGAAARAVLPLPGIPAGGPPPGRNRPDRPLRPIQPVAPSEPGPGQWESGDATSPPTQVPHGVAAPAAPAPAIRHRRLDPRALWIGLGAAAIAVALVAGGVALAGSGASCHATACGGPTSTSTPSTSPATSSSTGGGETALSPVFADIQPKDLTGCAANTGRFDPELVGQRDELSCTGTSGTKGDISALDVVLVHFASAVAVASGLREFDTQYGVPAEGYHFKVGCPVIGVGYGSYAWSDPGGGYPGRDDQLIECYATRASGQLGSDYSETYVWTEPSQDALLLAVAPEVPAIGLATEQRELQAWWRQHGVPVLTN